MRIRRIAVENFRKLRDPVKIDSLQSGLNLIVGDNEEGKSTLLKAVQAAFFDKHSMTGRAVEAMLPFGSQVQPRVAVEFEVGKASYSLHKGFNLSRFAKLGNAERSWENTHAEEKLKEILGFTPPNTGSAKDENRGLSGPLWVEQGHAYDPLKLNEDTKKALNEAIEKEVDAAHSGDDGSRLLVEVHSKFNEYYTPARNQERPRLTDPRGLVQSLKGKIESLEREKGQYDEKLDNLEKVKQELPSLMISCRQAQKRVSDIKAKVGIIGNKEKEIGIANADLEAAKARLREAINLSKTRNAKKTRLSGAKEDAKNRNETFGELDERRTNAKNKQATAKAELEQAQLECKRAKLKEISDKLAQAENIVARIAQKEKAVEEIPIGNEDIVELRGFRDELNVQKAKLEGIATTLVFSPSSNQSVSTNGEELEIDEPIRITEKTLFELEGFGELEVTPGGDEEDILGYHSKINDLQDKLKAGLRNFGYSSVEQADEAYARKNELAGEIGIDKANLDGLAPGGLENLRSDVEGLRRELPPPEDLTKPILPLDEAEEKRESAQAELERLQGIFSGIQNQWNIEQGAMRQLKQHISEIQSGIDEDRRSKSDEALETDVSEAQAEQERRQSRLRRLNTELEQLNPDLTRQELIDEEQSHDTLQGSLNDKRLEKKALEGLLRGLGQLGLGEEIERRHSKLKDARIELQRQELNAGAWKLLKHTLEKAQQEARVPLTPLMQRLEPYIQMVFPDAKLHLNEDSLEIDELHRENSKEPFPSLSIGTREQVAVLVRLAMADMLREQGRPVMLILDDPLVNSDDGRFSRMARALRKAAENLQILILTCHEDRYRSLGADAVRRMEPKKQESIADLLAMPNADSIDLEPVRLSGDLYRPADLS